MTACFRQESLDSDMSGLRNIIRRVGLGILSVLAVLLCLFLARFGLHRPVIYKIAENYRGWVVVRYKDQSCMPLGHDSIFLLVTVPSSGSGCTSSAPPAGWRYERYQYVNRGKVTRELPVAGWGGQGEIWGGFTSPAIPAESFFVGTEQELQRSWSQRPIL